MRFRKKPIEIEAVQFTGDNWMEVRRFCGSHPNSSGDYMIVSFNPIETYSQSEDPNVTAEVWDKLHSTWVGVKNWQWIIKGVQGEFYPCADDVFKASYDPVVERPKGGPSFTGDKHAVIVFAWTYEEQKGPGIDVVMTDLAPHIPDGVHGYAAIEQTAQNILAQFDEDEHD